MGKRDKSEVFKGKANKGKIKKQWEKERMRVRETRNDRDKEPKVDWVDDPHNGTGDEDRQVLWLHHPSQYLHLHG